MLRAGPLSLSLALVALYIGTFTLARDLRFARNSHQAALSLPPSIDSDPLASLSPLFGHSASGRTFAMPAVPQTQEQSDSGLQYNYEVNRPTRILPSASIKSNTITLATHSFVNSYGHPFIMTYSPSMFPAGYEDPNQWVFIEMTVSGNVSGRQFDRLGSVQLDGVEVWRLDNAEPTPAGVQWSSSKEMNKYFDLFRQDRALVFDFPNIVNDVYTGALNMTLSFTVYVLASTTNKLPPLSASYPQIFALSKKSFAENSFFHVGENGGDSGLTQVKLPINAVAALVEIYASGTANDEFWYTDVPDFLYEQVASQASKIGLFPRGPLREIQVLIDNRLAGIAQPYPVVFTGGISPYFWRPQVAYGAFNQPTYYIDISPFLGSLTDDAEHQIQLKVVSAEKNQTVLSWFISGNIQVQLDSTSERTTGSITLYDAPFAGDLSQTGQVGPDFNETGNLQFQVEGPRSITIEGTLKPGSSATAYPISWKQNIYYSNSNQLNKTNSVTVQHASGLSQSFHNSKTAPFYSHEFSYPFETGSIRYNYTIDHGFDETVKFSLPLLFKEPSNQQISMTQKGKANMVINSQGQLVSGSGQTSTSYSYSDTNGFSFTQTNKALNGTVADNQAGGNLASKATKV